MRYDIVFDAPTPAQAYASAPELAGERAAVARLMAELTPGSSVAQRREALLRRAAVTDRWWWAERGTQALWEATQAARDLMGHDRRHGDEVAGPHGPDSIEWGPEGGPRAYVRQEYRHWLTVPPGCADPCPESDPCPWHAR